MDMVPLALIVEDNLLVLDLVAEVVGDLGYRVIEATDGPEAIEAMDRGGDGDRDRGGFDLLVADQRLPGPLRGDALARRFRAAFPAARILLTSGEPLIGDLSGAAFLQKPFTVAMLKAALIERRVDA